MHFVEGKRVIKRLGTKVPPLFEVIAREGKTPAKNTRYLIWGIGWEVYL